MKKKTYLKYGIGILIIDVIISMMLIHSSEPHPSESITIIIYIPFLFVINSIIALTLYFKKKSFMKLFVINAMIFPTIFYFFWSNWFANWNERYYTNYQFKIGNQRLEISLTKYSNSFDILDITNKDQGYTTGLYFGEYEQVNDTIFLNDPYKKVKMFITNNELFDYPNKTNKTKLNKIN